MPAEEPTAVLVRFVPSGRELHVPAGVSVFDAIRQAGLPLGSSCDGDAICGWCRVQIHEGVDALNAPDEIEARLLAKRGAEADERIACMARIKGPICVGTSYW